MQRWVDHDRVIDYGWADVQQLCSVLGRAHDALSADDGLRDLGRWDSTSSLLNTLRAAVPELSRQAKTKELRVDDQLIQATRVLEAVVDRDSHSPSADEPTHGDLTGGNALMKGNRVAALIDFGMLARRPRTADLAAAMFWPFLIRELRHDAPLDWTAARGAVASYISATARPFDETELADVVHQLARIPAAGVAVAGRELDPSAEIVTFGRALPLATWLLEDPDRAQALLSP